MIFKKKIFTSPKIHEPKQIYDAVFQESDLTWESLLIDIIEKEKMNVWDIDVSLIANKYLETIRKLLLLDYRLSGRILLASAILLKMKVRTIDFEEFFKWKHGERKPKEKEEIEVVNPDELEIVNAVPNPRRRKVTLNDLLSALKSAIEETEKKKELSKYKEKLTFEVENLKRSEFNIVSKIREVLERVKIFAVKFKSNKVEFKELIPSESRKDIVWTFNPLLYLSNSGDVKLEQEETFSDLFVVLQNEREN